MNDFFNKVGLQIPPVPSSDRAQSYIDDARHLANARRWSVRDGLYWGVAESCDSLPAGMYSCGYSDALGPHAVHCDVKTDGLLHLPDDASAAILTEFEKFWGSEEEFRKRGFLMKRGFLLWGPPGSGKTTTVNLLSLKLIEQKNGVILIAGNPALLGSVLRMIRKIEPARPMIVIMEDLDALIRNHGESEYLAILDGEAQADNITFVATTNYPEYLDRRFVDRPSRFDTLQLIGMPNAAARRLFLQTKEPGLQGEELDLWVKHSDGFSIAHLKEMIVAVRCLGQPLEEAVGRLEEMSQRRPSSEDLASSKVVGFGRTKR
jgi:energy-coupling factor transporter ATP-binding protein EcfA2